MTENQDNYFVFDKDHLKNFKTNTKYVIGADVADEDVFVYNLYRVSGDSIEILLSKRMLDKSEFKDEVKNLKSYFNSELMINGTL